MGPGVGFAFDVDDHSVERNDCYATDSLSTDVAQPSLLLQVGGAHVYVLVYLMLARECALYAANEGLPALPFTVPIV